MPAEKNYRRIDSSQVEDNSKTESKTESKSKESSIEFYPEEPRYSFNDLILPENVKDQILDVADYAENSKIVFETWNLQSVFKQSKRVGINLYGAPGTGKTMAAHAIAKHLGRKILAVNYADIESKYVGETPKNIRKAFEAAKSTNSILFFDEADAILSKRVTNMTSATDVSVNQTRSVMLMVMNDYQDFVIFATNFIENFDPAFMRRISSHIEFPLPDLKCRRQLWEHYIPKEMPNDIDAVELATKYEGISGSDISNAILMAAFKAARRRESIVRKELVFESIEAALASKRANENVEVETRPVSKEYVEEQVAKGNGVVLKK
ncbi:MAG: ATP-binding protein [Selenomonadaceae bacterium]|nr:ATP-binding protein [Selenomonadaceae bacterium]